MAGQKFAQALDRAARASATWPAVQVAGAGESDGIGLEEVESQGATPDGLAEDGFGSTDAPDGGVDAMAQAAVLASAESTGAAPEVDTYLAERQKRQKARRVVRLSVLGATIVVVIVYFIIGAQRQRQKQEAAEFLSAFMDVDNGPVAGFWRCTVRSKHADVHRAQDNLVLASGLQKAFNAFPKEQPDYLDRKCLPMLKVAATEINQLKPPAAFVEPLGVLLQQFDKIEAAMRDYIKALQKATQLAAREKEVIDAASRFHDPASGARAGEAYVRLLSCAVPGLAQMARRIRLAPNSQPVVEYVYNACKADVSFADRLRRRCFRRLKGHTSRRDKTYRLVAKKMSGDDRDISAIKHCFETANKHLFSKELAAVGKSWVDYRNAVKGVLNQVSLYKGD